MLGGEFMWDILKWNNFLKYCIACHRIAKFHLSVIRRWMRKFPTSRNRLTEQSIMILAIDWGLNEYKISFICPDHFHLRNSCVGFQRVIICSWNKTSHLFACDSVTVSRIVFRSLQEMPPNENNRGQKWPSRRVFAISLASCKRIGYCKAK